MERAWRTGVSCGREVALLVLVLVLACTPAETRQRPDYRRRQDDTAGGDSASGDTAADSGAPDDTAADSGAPDDTGSAGGCGDGVAEGRFEECDGDDAADCPGACSAHCACPATAASGRLEVAFLDVGQGDAVVVVSPDGFVLLVDGGENGQAPAVEGWLAERGLEGIDYTLASHYHADHVGALDDVLYAHPEVSSCFDRGGDYPSSSFQGYTDVAGTRRTTVEPGDYLDLGPSVVAEVVQVRDDAWEENGNSVVLRLTFGAVAVLLGGDCSTEECELLFDPGFIDVYKVHHHGSSDASARAFLDLAGPRLAVIPVGADNDYGHPAEATLARLAEVGAAVRRTDEEGDIVVTTEGSSLETGAATGE